MQKRKTKGSYCSVLATYDGLVSVLGKKRIPQDETIARWTFLSSTICVLEPLGPFFPDAKSHPERSFGVLGGVSHHRGEERTGLRRGNWDGGVHV